MERTFFIMCGIIILTIPFILSFVFFISTKEDIEAGAYSGKKKKIFLFTIPRRVILIMVFFSVSYFYIIPFEPFEPGTFSGIFTLRKPWGIIEGGELKKVSLFTETFRNKNFFPSGKVVIFSDDKKVVAVIPPTPKNLQIFSNFLPTNRWEVERMVKKAAIEQLLYQQNHWGVEIQIVEQD